MSSPHYFLLSLGFRFRVIKKCPALGGCDGRTALNTESLCIFSRRALRCVNLISIKPLQSCTGLFLSSADDPLDSFAEACFFSFFAGNSAFMPTSLGSVEDVSGSRAYSFRAAAAKPRLPSLDPEQLRLLHPAPAQLCPLLAIPGAVCMSLRPPSPS